MIDTHKHLVSRAFSKGFLRDIQSHALDILDSAGLFQDEEVKQVKDEFMPWLYSEVKTELDKFTMITEFVESNLSISRQNDYCRHLEYKAPQRDRSC